MSFLDVPGITPAGLDAKVTALQQDPDSGFRAAQNATYALKGEVGKVGGVVATSIASVDKFRLGVLSADLTTPTYDGSGAAVHPSVLYFPQGWNGHRYWMAMTPYPTSNNKLENPSILVSNDGNTWAVPAGVTNPLVPAPAGTDYNSDTHLAMGPDGLMYLLFRQFIGSQDELCIMSTADGTTWTAPVVVMSNAMAVRRLVSPAFWWDGGNNEWVMLAVDIVGTARVVRSTAAQITGPWATPADVSLTAGLPAGRLPWHLDAKDVGGTIIALIQDGNSAGGNLYYAVSGDQGKSLKLAPNMIANNAYRSSFVPLFTESGIILDTWVGYLNGDIKRGTASVPALTADDFVHPIIPAAQGVKPYVLGDNFNRADSTTGLGTASSGQAYTVWGGTPGIIGNKAYATTAVNTKVAVDTGLANGVATLDLDFVGDTDQAWLIFRGIDTNNYWSVGRRNNEYRLLKTVAGTQTIVYALAASAFVPGATVKAEYNGTTIKFYADNVLLHTASDSANQAGTFVGWQAFVTATRLDNLTCRKLTA